MYLLFSYSHKVTF